jgi:hypothetical protein
MKYVVKLGRFTLNFSEVILIHNMDYNVMSSLKNSYRWLRHYATSRKVAGSSPDEVIGMFQFS